MNIILLGSIFSTLTLYKYAMFKRLQNKNENNHQTTVN